MTLTAMQRAASALVVALWLVGCAAPQPEQSPELGTQSPTLQVGTAAAVAAQPDPTYADVDARTLNEIIVAELAGRRGRLDLATKNYLDVATRHQDAGLAERATSIAVYAQDTAGSLQASKLWSQLAPDSLEAAQVLGALLLRADQRDASAKVLRRVVVLGKDDPDAAYARLSELLSREKNRSAALDVMRKLVALDDNALPARFALAAMMSRVGSIDEARKTLKQLSSEYPADVQVNEYYARVLQSQGKTDEARAWLDNFLARNPNAVNARMSYARILVGEKKYAEAAEQFEQLMALNADDADGRYALAIVRMQLEDYPGAKANFQGLVDRGQRRDAANYYLGQLAERAEDVDLAILSYGRVERGEFLLNARIRSAGLLADRGELASARASLHGLHRIYRSENVRLYRAEAELIAKTGDFESAIEIYDEALISKPKNTDLLYSRAMLAARTDRVADLERDLRDILTREPNNADALNALGYTLADKTDRYQEALSYVERALKLKPEDHYVIDSMGWVLFRLGRYEESVAQLRRAWSIRQDAEVAAHLGEVLWVMGRQDEAREVWNKALEDDPDSESLKAVMQRLTQ